MSIIIESRNSVTDKQIDTCKISDNNNRTTKEIRPSKDSGVYICNESNLQSKIDTCEYPNIIYWYKEDNMQKKKSFSKGEVIKYSEIWLRLIDYIIVNDENLQLKRYNSYSSYMQLFIGILWRNNKIEDIIFREACYRKRIWVPVILNYSNDTPETTAYKLQISCSNFLLYDCDIPDDYINRVKFILKSDFHREITLINSRNLFDFDKISNIQFNIDSNAKDKKWKNLENTSILKNRVDLIENDVIDKAEDLSQRNEVNNLQDDLSTKMAIIEMEKQNFISDSFENFEQEEIRFRKSVDLGLNSDNNWLSMIKTINFTSGTTGKPKAVKLSYQSYDAMVKTFNRFWKLKKDMHNALLVTNPLHHINSSALVEWCIRNPSMDMILIEKYSRNFWDILVNSVRDILNTYKDKFLLIVPLVPKHFEYFYNMIREESYKNVDESIKYLSHPCIQYLFGSSAVSYEFICKFQSIFSGKIPRIRFGSTETCLQVCGTDMELSEERIVQLLKEGYNTVEDSKTGITSKLPTGYFIGRPIYPYSEVKIVKSIDPNSIEFMVSTEEYEVGYFICRGPIIMTGYMNSTSDVLVDKKYLKRIILNKQIGHSLENMVHTCDVHPWYIGLGDEGFWLNSKGDNNVYPKSIEGSFDINPQDMLINNCKDIENNSKQNKSAFMEFQLDLSNSGICKCCKGEIEVQNIWYYWKSRSIGIVKIGGVKYSCEEMSSRIKDSILTLYNNLQIPSDISFLVYGIKGNNTISEDDKLVLIYEPFEGSYEIRETLINKLKNFNILHKAYIPEFVIEMPIPRTFKGTINYLELKLQVDSMISY
ncbi:hypothetical protein cand_000510 [Cryptosporidium andersoni]|uniref:AMP-dependent synthetase/ligase domain-containing protein n=1 Tax=Cryptosporidium andersoni TaxID=117008 RepID=A0A1J4MQK8_9CRYT|nr:hypothetical protein cand_000510 [Cryptosporidium andersoni]